MKRTTKNDFTMRVQSTGGMAVSKNNEYLCNIAQRLFHMIPGTDDYEKDMGLDIDAQSQRHYVEGERDSEYEERIGKQFNTYTDIFPLDIIVTYKNKYLTIFMDIVYKGEEYVMQVTNDPLVLSTQIQPKSITY